MKGPGLIQICSVTSSRRRRLLEQLARERDMKIEEADRNAKALLEEIAREEVSRAAKNKRRKVLKKLKAGQGGMGWASGRPRSGRPGLRSGRPGPRSARPGPRSERPGQRSEGGRDRRGEGGL
jgi:hypothetical protein